MRAGFRIYGARQKTFDKQVRHFFQNKCPRTIAEAFRSPPSLLFSTRKRTPDVAILNKTASGDDCASGVESISITKTCEKQRPIKQTRTAQARHTARRAPRPHNLGPKKSPLSDTCHFLTFPSHHPGSEASHQEAGTLAISTQIKKSHKTTPGTRFEKQMVVSKCNTISLGPKKSRLKI